MEGRQVALAGSVLVIFWGCYRVFTGRFYDQS